MLSRDYKEKARKDLQGKWWTVGFAVFLFSVLPSVLSGIFEFAMIMANYQGSSLQKAIELFNSSHNLAQIKVIIDEYNKMVQSVSSLSSIILFLGVALLSFGIYEILINTCKGFNVAVGDLFKGVKYFGKMLLLLLLVTLYTTLWTCLLIVPGIIKAYSYSMALFIFVENPEMGVNECITESRRIMNGQKWNYFCLGISFIGWYLLFVVCILVPILNVFILYRTMTYMYVSQAEFFLHITGADQTVKVDQPPVNTGM